MKLNRAFWEAAAVRAIRTFCQAFLAVASSAALLSEVSWAEAISSAALAALLSIVTSIATGLPEAD